MPTPLPIADLHLHSTASDGTDPPATLAQRVADANLAGFALTDHDTTAGLADAAHAAATLNLTFLPGIELSADPASALPPTPSLSAAKARVSNTNPPQSQGTLHLLGYAFDPTHPTLTAVQRTLADARAQRNPAMVARLNDLGVRIAYDEVTALADAQGAAAVGRPHIAQVMLDKGYVKSIHDAFQRYLGQGAAAHTRKDRLSAADAIAAIRDAGGVAVLAHPVQLTRDEDRCEYAVRRLVDLGLAGIETNHPDHTPADVARLHRLAQRLNLLTTAGSDHHGTRKPNQLGHPAASLDQLHALRNAAPAPTP